MTVSPSFLATCKAAALLLPEYATFAAALAALSSAAEEDRQARWRDCYSDAQAGMSPAYRFRRAVRDVIANNATNDHSPADRESAYQTLTADLASEQPPPAPLPVKSPVLTPEDLDMARMVMSKLAYD